MRYALYRLTAPILDRIPDISHQPKGRQISIGFAVSVLIHLLLLLLALVIGFVLPSQSPLRFLSPKPKLEEIELTVLPPPAPEMRSVPLEEPPFLDSRGLNPADKPPESAVFQSGRDMKAASEAPPSGALPLPSQEGRVAPKTPEFEQQKLGRETPPQPVAKSMTPPAPVPPQPETKTPDPATAPPTPPPVAKETPGGEKPVTLKQADQPSEDEIALQTKQKVAQPPPKIHMRSTAPLAMLAPPPAPPPAEPVRRTESGADMQTEKTRVAGNISNRGRNAVDAKATPLGRYNEAVGRAIGSRWNHYIKDKGDLVALGSVRVFFSIDRKGRVSGVRTDDNTSNSAFAEVCEKAVLDSEFPPPGKDLTDALADGKLDITFTFTLY